MSKTSIRILYVDDYPFDRELVRTTLENADFDLQITEAASRSEFEEKLAQAKYDLVLSDFNILGFTGLQVLDAVWATDQTIPVIIVTGTGSEEIAVETLKRGAADYVIKSPKHIQRLPNTIKGVLEKEKLKQHNRQAEEALRESQKQLQQIVNSIRDHIYVTELTASGERINRYISTNVRALTGYPLEKFINDWNFWGSQVIHPADRDVAAAQARRLAQGQASQVEYRMIRADGEVIWVRDSANVEPQGQSTIVYGVVGNITERKQLEEQLQQSQKLEALGRLAGGIAHDFNNLLTVILGNCDLALDQIEQASLIRDELEGIKTAGERAVALVRQLLAFSRQQILQPQILDLNAVVATMNQMLQRLIGSDIILVSELGPQAATVKADQGQIEQVIMNLVINARDAMPTGGTLRISTETMALEKGATREWVDLEPGHYAVLTIQDSGIGMDQEVMNHIFDPFFTTKEAGKGTGLGLSTVHGIIKQSNGHIWVDSQINQGTKFTILLPKAEIETIDRQEPTNEPSPQSAKTILLVEDEDMIRDLAQRTLLKDGYLVLEAKNGQEALDIFNEYSGTIDLLLTDIVMPGKIAGDKLAKIITSLRPETKILYISGHPKDIRLTQNFITQNSAFLQKPFTPSKLAHKVREVLDIKVSPTSA
ncbi:MAG: response regulator [Anaerolineae bacterium]|nr:response regulator [Anaerolineae bacterium]MCB0178326.1 response regulator [Anaerolineae bacterium]MCB9103453.1 response regulator [Anaerolineales bacterium]